MNCLRCGRTIPEQVLLCPECTRHNRLAPAKVPTPVDTYVNEDEVIRETAKKLRRSNRLLHRWVAAMILFAVISVGLLGYGIVTISARRDQLAAQITRANSLQTAMEDLQSELTAANALIESMSQIIARYGSITGLSPEELS